MPINNADDVFRMMKDVSDKFKPKVKYWVAYKLDEQRHFSDFAVFSTEIEALRFANAYRYEVMDLDQGVSADANR